VKYMKEQTGEMKPFESRPIFPNINLSKLRDKNEMGVAPAVLVEPKTRAFLGLLYQNQTAYNYTRVDDNASFLICRYTPEKIGNELNPFNLKPAVTFTDLTIQEAVGDCDDDTVLYSVRNPEIITMSGRRTFDSLDFSGLRDSVGMGVITAVVLDVSSFVPLMVAFMNEDALEKTKRERLATFWSRSRQESWTKGETSGNVINVKGVGVLDKNTVVVLGEPVGPVCHTGTRTCFDKS